jgi:hypothetical protein
VALQDQVATLAADVVRGHAGMVEVHDRLRRDMDGSSSALALTPRRRLGSRTATGIDLLHAEANEQGWRAPAMARLHDDVDGTGESRAWAVHLADRGAYMGICVGYVRLHVCAYVRMYACCFCSGGGGGGGHGRGVGDQPCLC